MDKMERKRRHKKLCLQIGLWIIVYVLGSQLLLVTKNNEDAIFIFNNQPSEVYAKAVKVSF